MKYIKYINVFENTIPSRYRYKSKIRKIKENSDKEKCYQEFIEDYNSHYNSPNTDINYYIKAYSIPNIFVEETKILYYYYNYSYLPDEIIRNYIKNRVKKDTLKSIMKKFEIDPDSYNNLQKTVNKRLNSNGGFNIHVASMKYIFFLLKDALNKAPEWIKNSNKYNL